MSFLSKNLRRRIKIFLRKTTFLIILATVLASILFLRPYFNGYYEKPSFEDRLPQADFLGRCQLLDVAKETSDMLFYHKIPFRDLFSYEFLLGQGKSYGLNLQKPIFLFANENGNWGVIIHVTDSSKIFQGIQRLSKWVEIKDTLWNEQKVYTYTKEKGYITYDHNWLFLYKGTGFSETYNRIIYAKKGGLEPCWKSFLNEKQFKDEKLVLYSNWKKLQDQGLETALFAHNSDSSSFSLLSYFRNKKPLNIKMKKDGIELKNNSISSRELNIHLDIANLRNAFEDPIYKFLIKLGKKIAFPTKEFLNAWEGDLCFTQGGFTTIHETFIESVMDEEFNITEVKKIKEEKIPGFSLLLSVNSNAQNLINLLFAKGILTKHDKHFQFLASPPLSFIETKSSLLFYSGESYPKLINGSKNHGVWTQRGTKIGFAIDSISSHEIFGTIHIPVDRLIRRNKFF
ncbi:MAG: hypothetical protein HYR91_02075 [Flavobacteriia bacterium]|nr:hypothetical protein [Flavobacteriia bacterium]